MESGVLDVIDATLQQRCACPCGQPLNDRSPSGYFASEECANRWHRGGAQPDLDLPPYVVRSAMQQAAQIIEQAFRGLAAGLQPLVDNFISAATAAAEQMRMLAGGCPAAPRTGPQHAARAVRKIEPATGWRIDARTRVYGARPRRG